MNIPEPQSYQPAPRVLFQALHGEMVLLDLESQRYFGLNEVGARTWQLLVEGQAISEILARLEAEFDVDRPRLDQDVQALLAQLMEAGLVVPAA